MSVSVCACVRVVSVESQKLYNSMNTWRARATLLSSAALALRLSAACVNHGGSGRRRDLR